MGNDPQTSVVDKFGRVHDTPNVFVSDASLHVNNGGFNPAVYNYGIRVLGRRSHRIRMAKRKQVCMIKSNY